MLGDAALLGDGVTSSTALLVYANARADLHLHCDFADFVVALVAVATLRNPLPWLQPAHRLALLLHKFLPALAGRVGFAWGVAPVATTAAPDDD